MLISMSLSPACPTKQVPGQPKATKQDPVSKEQNITKKTQEETGWAWKSLETSGSLPSSYSRGQGSDRAPGWNTLATFPLEP